MKKWAFIVVVALAVIGQVQPVVAGPPERQGMIAEVQLVDASSLDGDNLLILTLESGGGFLVPGQRNLAASSGMKVAVEYLLGEEQDELPVACRIRVLAVPLEVNGEEVLQPASRPFEIYRNPDSQCQYGESGP